MVSSDPSSRCCRSALALKNVKVACTRRTTSIPRIISCVTSSSQHEISYCCRTPRSVQCSRTNVGVPRRSRFSSNGNRECSLFGTQTIFLLGSSCTHANPASRRPSSCRHKVLWRKRCAQAPTIAVRCSANETEPKCRHSPAQAAILLLFLLR